MPEFTRLNVNAGRAVFVWSMGVTVHKFGVENVRAIIDLALARGMVGRPGTVAMFWPEAHVLVPRGVSDPQCGIPACRDAWVEVLPAREAEARG